MSNALTTIVAPTDLAFVRTAKSGKQAVRGLMGLMSSGNKIERHSALDALVAYHWENGQYKPILREFARVFAGKGFDAIVNILCIDLDKPNKLVMLGLFGALVRGTEGKTLKGEKLAYQGYATDLLAKANAVAAIELTGDALDAAIKAEFAQLV